MNGNTGQDKHKGEVESMLNAYTIKKGTYLDKNKKQLKHGDFILWNPVDDDWMDVIIEQNGKLTTVLEISGQRLLLKDCLFGSKNPVLRVGNLETHDIKLTQF